jgi:hypothetical protein
VGAHSANFKACQRLSNSPTLLNPLDATFTKNRGVAGSSQLRSCLPSGRAECLPARQSRNGPKYLALVGIVRLMEHLLGEADRDELDSPHHSDPRRYLRHHGQAVRTQKIRREMLRYPQPAANLELSSVCRAGGRILARCELGKSRRLSHPSILLFGRRRSRRFR